MVDLRDFRGWEEVTLGWWNEHGHKSSCPVHGDDEGRESCTCGPLPNDVRQKILTNLQRERGAMAFAEWIGLTVEEPVRDQTVSDVLDGMIRKVAVGMQGAAYGAATLRKARIAVETVLIELSRHAYALRPEDHSEPFVTAEDVGESLRRWASQITFQGRGGS